MQCVTPMFYYYKIGDKKHGKIVPRLEVLDELNYNPNYIRNALKRKNNLAELNGHRYIQVPCQKCWACQLKYSAEWATRITKECEKYENNWYITLTYADHSLPIAEKTEWDSYEKDQITGEIIKTHEIRENDGTWQGTLNPEDMDRFLNSLRKHVRDKYHHEGVKYFYCGEYGTEKHRPHYHIILMNCPLDPTLFYKPRVDGKNFKAHWQSKELENIWADDIPGTNKRKPKGIIDVAEVEWSCAAYVARYCTKKLYAGSDKSKYLENGLYPEFIRPSKGIGMDYLKSNLDEIYRNDEIIMRTIRGNLGAIKPPRAYDKKLKEINPKLYEKIKKSREKAKERTDKLLQNVSDATDLMRLEQNARNLETKMSLLPRPGEW